METELAGNHAILRLLENEKGHYITPENMPAQIRKQIGILRQRNRKIMELMENG